MRNGVDDTSKTSIKFAGRKPSGFFYAQKKQERGVKKMRCLILGTDHLGVAPEILENCFGVKEFIHWNGRKRIRCNLKNIDLIVIYTGFVNHSAMWQIKKMAKKHGIRTVFINRGLSELEIKKAEGGLYDIR